MGAFQNYFHVDRVQHIVGHFGGKAMKWYFPVVLATPKILLLAFVSFSALQLPMVNTAQILGLFSHPGKSHFDFFRPLFLELAAKGHNVTVISYFPNKIPVANYTDYELSGLQIFADFIDLQNFGDGAEQLLPFKIPTFFMLHGWGMEACEVALKSEIIQNLISARSHWDVIILEQFNNDCMMAVAHLLQAPVVALSSCALMPWHYGRMGSPFLPAFMPMNFLPYTDEMSFVHRVNNFVHFHAVNLLYNFYTQPQTNVLIRKHLGRSVPPVEELVKQTRIMLINQHFSLNGAYPPYTPNIIEVGGLQIQAEKPLEGLFPFKNLKQLLDTSSEGVIYISWGSMIRPETLPKHKLDTLLKVINQFSNYDFVMKWSDASLPGKPKNLHTLKWMPQRDILCHRNVRAFMTHGGLLGASEAVYCGVPMMVTPFYGDQFLNAVAIQKRKLGLIVQYKDFNQEDISNALTKIMQPSFLKGVKLASEAYRNRPQDPLALSVFWVEHVIQTKGAALAQNAAVHQLRWFTYNSIDVYLFLLTLATILITIFGMLCRTCLRIFARKNKIKLQ